MNNNSSYNEMIRRENEITKLKIQAEFGVEINNTEEINPAIENIWLKNILEFERAALNKEKITVGEKIGNPVLAKSVEISDENISVELQQLMELLRKNNIIVETLDGASDRELYRFITKELFLEEMNIVEIPNMFMFFIYEEFHPNNECDIKRHSQDFMNALVNRKDDFIDNFLSFNKEEEQEVKIQNLKRRLLLFRDAYDDLRLEEFNISSLIFDELNAELKFEFRIGVLLPGSHTFHEISGPGRFRFIFELGFWGIEEIEMSGVV